MLINFIQIDKTNYLDCISLELKPEQEFFVASNAQSLLDAHYNEGLYPLGITLDGILVGFLLYDFDYEIAGWSLSRFMIGKEYQGKGIGKAALESFIKYFYQSVGYENLFASISVDNEASLSLFTQLGFRILERVEYTHRLHTYVEYKVVLHP